MLLPHNCNIYVLDSSKVLQCLNLDIMVFIDIEQLSKIQGRPAQNGFSRFKILGRQLFSFF